MGLDISNTGSTQFPSETRNLHLNNVLHVDAIAQNLFSVHKLCTENKVLVKFSPSSFQVKDLNSGAMMVQGRTKDGGYMWPSRDCSSFFAFSTFTKTPLAIWHSRLGHPSLSVLKSTISASLLSDCNSLSTFYCTVCSIKKSQKLPLSMSSSFITTKPLNLFTQAFGHHLLRPLMVSSIMMSLWIIILITSGSTIRCQAHFHTMENCSRKPLQSQTISFHSNNGGENVALTDFLSTSRLSHLTTPPSTQLFFRKTSHTYNGNRPCTASIPTTY